MSERKNVVFIVVDGLADRPITSIGGLTPLEVASKPGMDKLAEIGICGILDIISPGVPPGSDVAHLSLFGYDPYAVYRGRGGLEALGAGINISSDDVAFRANFATVGEDMKVLDRRAGRSLPEGDVLAKSLNGYRSKLFPDVEVTVKHTTEHRCVVVLRGLGLSHMVSDTDPHKEGSVMQAIPLDSTPEAKKTASVVNEFTMYSYESLRRHPLNFEREKKGLRPANILLLRGAGRLPNMASLRELYGLRAACIVANALVRGVCKAAGMDVIEVKGVTGSFDTDINAMGHAALKLLDEYDLVFLHIKGTDSASHDGDLEKKIFMIEKADKLVSLLLDSVELDRTYLVLTADHTTPVLVKDHTGEPVPVAIAGPGIRSDDVKRFSERDCAKGGLGRIQARFLMPILIDYLGLSKKYGA
ncbi:MAG: 2,3-bisphosphoglycerate-independent phosphoglycerate mutase [Candidatus Jordarchaeales archaeon]